MLNKIKYLFYSKEYKKFYSSTGIKNIINANYVYLGRQNGKTIKSLKWDYIRAVENHEFEAAKLIKKTYKKIFHKKIF